jgi:hypothetical protein
MTRLTKVTMPTLLATLIATAIPGARAGAQALSCSPEPVAPASTDAGCSEAPVTGPARPTSLTRSRMFHQIRYHLALPASRPRILDSLAATAELGDAEAAWIAAALPRRTFTSGADVLVALFPDTPPEVLARVDPPALVARR